MRRVLTSSIWKLSLAVTLYEWMKLREIQYLWMMSVSRVNGTFGRCFWNLSDQLGKWCLRSFVERIGVLSILKSTLKMYFSHQNSSQIAGNGFRTDG
jgi:hypothetical protein